jgi:tryptophan-rich sensory protein
MSMRPGTVATSAATVFVSAVVGRLANRPADSGWYARLREPSFQLNR